MARNSKQILYEALTTIPIDQTAVPGTGTVSSVALTAPSILSVSGSPVTTTGTLGLTLATQTANTVFSGPTTGAAATPTFRALVAADIPSLSGTYQPLNANLTTISGLTATTDNFIVSVASAWASRTPTQAKTTLSLNNVENTALSTWAGTTNLITLGAATATSVAVAAGTSATNGKVSCSLFSHTADVTTSGTTEESAIADTIPANALAANGDRLTIEYGGIFASNANNKLIKVQFGGTGIINTGVLVENGTAWRITLTIIRDSSTSVKYSGQFNSGVYWTPVEGKITGLTLSNTNTLDLRIRTGTSAGDLTVYMGTVNWESA